MRPAYLGVWLCAAASLTAAPPAAPRAQDDDAAPLVQLRFAELRDRDHSGGASAGDEVVLGLRRVLGPRRKVTLSDLPLANAGDGWGEGAVVASVPGRDEISITLGRGAALTLAGTYRNSVTAPGSTADIDECAKAVRLIHGALESLERNPNERLLVQNLLWSLPDAHGV